MSGMQASVAIALVVIFAVLSSLAVFEHNARRHGHAAIIWCLLSAFVTVGICLLIALGFESSAKPSHASYQSAAQSLRMSRTCVISSAQTGESDV